MSEAKPPAIDTELAAHTAEMLCMPQIVCGHRDCRRGNRCRWFDGQSRLPHCVPALDDEERKLFDALYADAVYVKENWRGLDLMPGDGERRDLRDAAFAVVRATLPRSDWRAFARRMRVRVDQAFPAGSEQAHDMDAFERYLVSQRRQR